MTLKMMSHSEVTMEFLLTIKYDDVTITVQCPNLTDMSQLDKFFNSLTTKAIEEVRPVKRGRGRPRKGESK